MKRDIIDLKTFMTRREARQKLKDMGLLKKTVEVPKRHWDLIETIYKSRHPDEVRNSLHVQEEVYRFGRDRSLHVFSSAYGDTIEIHTELSVDD